MLRSIKQIIATFMKNVCTPYLRLRRGVHHSKMWYSLWCTTVFSQSESRYSGSTSTKGNKSEDTYTYMWWVRTTSGQVRDGPLIIMGRGQTDFKISFFLQLKTSSNFFPWPLRSVGYKTNDHRFSFLVFCFIRRGISPHFNFATLLLQRGRITKYLTWIVPNF